MSFIVHDSLQLCNGNQMVAATRNGLKENKLMLLEVYGEKSMDDIFEHTL